MPPAELCTELTIDKEFAALCPAPTAEELDLLEASLAAEGCTDPIVTWANHDDTILDGHTRYKICRREAIPFKIKPIRLESRGECVNWIIDRQLQRRNLTDEQKAFLRGKRYGSETRRAGPPLGGDTGVVIAPDGNSANELAQEYGMTVRSLQRDAAFAEAVDTIGEKVGEEAKATILAGKSPLGKAGVMAAAKLPPKKMAQAVATGRVPRADKPPKSGKQRVPHERFSKLESDIGACLRQTDALQKSNPADKFHRDVVQKLKEAVQLVHDWRKAVC